MCYEPKKGPNISKCPSSTENPKGTLLRITILKGTPFLDMTNPFWGAGSAQILLPSHLPFVITEIDGHQVSFKVFASKNDFYDFRFHPRVFFITFSSEEKTEQTHETIKKA